MAEDVTPPAGTQNLPHVMQHIDQAFAKVQAAKSDLEATAVRMQGVLSDSLKELHEAYTDVVDAIRPPEPTPPPNRAERRAAARTAHPAAKKAPAKKPGLASVPG